MPRSKPNRPTYSARIVFYDTPETKTRLEREARASGQNFSDFMRARERQLHQSARRNARRRAT